MVLVATVYPPWNGGGGLMKTLGERGCCLVYFFGIIFGTMARVVSFWEDKFLFPPPPPPPFRKKNLVNLNIDRRN